MTAKILIVDDAPTNRLIIKSLLERDFYTILEASNGVEALEIAHRDAPDLILLDIVMPEMDGFETCKRLKAKAKTTNIPVVMITSTEGRAEKMQGLEAGADDFLPKPINQEVLFARVRNLLRVKSLFDELQLRGEAAADLGLDDMSQAEMEAHAQRLLIISGDLALAEEWAGALKEVGEFEIDIETGEEGGLHLAQKGEFDSLIVAENLENHGIGMRLIAKLRAHWFNRDTTILFVAQSGTEAGLRSLELGSNDYMLAPFDPLELATRLRTQSRRAMLAKNLREQFSKQIRLSVIDPLTELHNRRYFDDYMPKMLSRANREQKPFALMMLDLDNFKLLNDRYGHDFGDQVLVEFAARAKENLRASDLIMRFGGEEFVVVTPGVSREEAEVVSERLRKVVAITPFETVLGEEVHVTTSVGVAMVEPGESDARAILKRADEALYRSKELGRNQVNFVA